MSSHPSMSNTGLSSTPITSRFLTAHSRDSSSLELPRRPKSPSSPYAPYSPFSPASEHDAFLSGARTPTPLFSPNTQESFAAGVSSYFEHHVALPPASKRRFRNKTLIIALPALIGLTLLAGVALYSDVSQARLVIHVKDRLHAGLEGIQSSLNVEKWMSSISTPEPIELAANAIEISVLPRPRAPTDLNADDKYLGYLPHSGYHNQRIELVQAMMLAKTLNRTLLVPPVWIGWPTGWSYYDELQRAWTEAMQTTERSFALPPRSAKDNAALYEPADFLSTRQTAPLNGSVYDNPSRMEGMAALIAEKRAHWQSLGYTEFRPDGYPITNLTAADCKSYTPECRHTYKDTFLSWDSLVNIDKAAKVVKLVDRWDIRERSLQKSLNVTAEDVFVFQDEVRMDFQFDSRVKPESPLINKNTNRATRWARTVSIDAMSKLEHKVLLVGTLFGSGRIRGPGMDYFLDELGQCLRKTMAFTNPWIIEPANEIRDRLGGPDGYAGVHARIGDGVFARHARDNMEALWRDLVTKLEVSEDVAEMMRDKVKPVNAEVELLKKRGLFDEDESSEWSEWALVDGDDSQEYNEVVEDENLLHLSKRSATGSQPSHRHRPRAVQVTNGPNCPGQLHTDPQLEAFNTRIYLATDSRSPRSDPNLSIFFDSFPCTFILADFEQDGSSVDQMTRLVNSADGVSLGRLFMPFLEASIAAKGFVTAGTPGSTFSIFAQGSLHDAFREEWEDQLEKAAEMEEELESSFGMSDEEAVDANDSNSADEVDVVEPEYSAPYDVVDEDPDVDEGNVDDESGPGHGLQQSVARGMVHRRTAHRIKA